MRHCPHIRNCWGVTRLGSKGLVQYADKNRIRQFFDNAEGEAEKCGVFDRGECPISQYVALGFDGLAHYNSEVPPALARARYDNVIQDIAGRNLLDTLQPALDVVDSWAATDDQNHLWIHGVHDVGKSWLAAAVLHRMLDTRRKSGLWITWGSIPNKYRQYVTMAGAVDAAKFCEALTRRDVIVLDDFTTDTENQAIYDFFYQALLSTLENGVTKIIITSPVAREKQIDNLAGSKHGSTFLRKMRPVVPFHYNGASR